jgi:hypothetical protein
VTTLAPVANEVEVIRKTKLDFSAPLTWRFRSLAQKPARKQFLAAFDKGHGYILPLSCLPRSTNISATHEIVPAAQSLPIEEKGQVLCSRIRIVESNLSSFLAGSKKRPPRPRLE